VKTTQFMTMINSTNHQLPEAQVYSPWM